jgi:hypothetical protein
MEDCFQYNLIIVKRPFSVQLAQVSNAYRDTICLGGVSFVLLLGNSKEKMWW